MRFQRNAAWLRPVASVHQSDAPAFPRRNPDAGSVLFKQSSSFKYTTPAGFPPSGCSENPLTTFTLMVSFYLPFPFFSSRVLTFFASPAGNSEIIEEATITEPPTTNCQYNGSPNMSTASNVANTLSKDNNIPLVVVDTRFIPYRHRKYGMIEHKIARKRNAPNGNAMVPITLKLPLNSVAIQQVLPPFPSVSDSTANHHTVY